MRHLYSLSAAGLAAGLVLAAAAADTPPPPILKPATPSGGQVRVRVPITGDPTTPYRIRAQVAKAGKGKAPGEPVEIVVGINTGKRAVATTKMVKSWGFTPGPDKFVTLPELYLVGYPIAPKAGKDAPKQVLARVTGVRVECLDTVAEGSDKVLGSDLIVGVHDLLTKGQDRAADPRLYFADKFFDMTFPAAQVKKPPMPGEAEVTLDPPGTADPGLAVVMAPLAARAGPVFQHAAFNGVDQIKTNFGMTEPVNVMVTAATTLPTGVIMSYGLALDLKLTVDLDKAINDFFTLDKKGKFVPTTVKELRIGVQTGKGFTAARELVIRDLDVVIDTRDSGHYAAVGPNFVNKYFADGVYAIGPDGQPKLYGRVAPDRLQEAKPKGKKK